MKRKSYALLSITTLALLLSACTQPIDSSSEPTSNTEPTSVSEEPTTSETPVTSEPTSTPTSEPVSEPSSEVITEFTISGTVLGTDSAPLADAVVTLGNDVSQAVFTDASGNFEFEAVELTAEIGVKVSHPSYFGEELTVDATQAVGADIDASFTLEEAAYVELGPDTSFGGKFALNATYEVAYGQDALALRSVAQGSGEWADNIKPEYYIDTGTATDGRDDTTFVVQPWAKLTYEDDMINYYGVDRPAIENMTGFVKYFDADVFVATVPYALLAVGENPTPVKGDTFGFSVGVWNETAADWDGWGWWSSPATDAQIAYNVEYGTNFIAPEISKRYVRLMDDGTITFAKNNLELWVFVPPVESNLAEIDLTTLSYQTFNTTFGGGQVPGGVAPFVSRSNGLALAMKFTTTQTSWDPYTVEFFLDTGSATADRVDGTTWLFNVFGTGNVATINSFGGTAFANTETKTTVVGQDLYFAVSYEALSMSNTDQFGVTFGAKAGGWDGWGLTGVPFEIEYNTEKGGGFVAPEIPHKYIRVLANGTLTWTTNDGKLVSRDTLTEGYRVLENTFGGKFFTGGIATKVRHSATGIEFVFTAPVNFETHHKLEVFIDTGMANLGQDASTRRIDVWANMVDTIEGVEKTLIGSSLTINILYTTLGISPTDQIGFSLGIWNESALDWDGFGYGDAPFAAAYTTAYGNTFIAPEHANRYVRLLSDDSLTFTLADFSFYHA